MAGILATLNFFRTTQFRACRMRVVVCRMPGMVDAQSEAVADDTLLIARMQVIF